MRSEILNSGEVLTIRQAVKGDAANLVRYVKRVADETSFLTFSGNEFNKTEEEEIQIIERHAKSENEVFMIGLIEHEIVSIVNVQASRKKRLKHTGDLGISVVQEHWGKGIGGLMLKAVFKWAERNKLVKRIGLTVSSNNEAAIHLYKNNGFEIEGVLRKDIYVNGEYLDSYVMGLLID